MNNLQVQMNNYLHFCQYQKCLDEKTLRAYRIDLKQFLNQLTTNEPYAITTNHLENFVASLHQIYKPKTAKRKIAAVKAFFHYMEYKDIISNNPFHKMQLKFREPIILPKTIPLYTLETLLVTIYNQIDTAVTELKKKNTIRDAAIIEIIYLYSQSCNHISQLILTHGRVAEHEFLSALPSDRLYIFTLRIS